MNFLRWIEDSSLALWVRESVWGFPASLILHAWAMAALVGLSLVLALSVWLHMPRLLTALAHQSRGPLWGSFTLSLVSGIFLLSAYPAKALTNPVFYFKLAMIGVALALALQLARQARVAPAGTELLLSPALRWLAVGLLLSWFTVIAAGRLLAYTYRLLSLG